MENALLDLIDVLIVFAIGFSITMMALLAGLRTHRP
jgi:hypothetical protein